MSGSSLKSVLKPAVPVDVAGARRAVQLVSTQMSELIRGIEDPHVRARKLEWTVGQTAAHTVGATEEFADYADGSAEPQAGARDVAEWNAHRIAELAIDDMGEAASRLDAAVARFLDATSARAASDPFPALRDVFTNVSAATGILLAEFLVHGFDIARGIGRPWPIEGTHASLALVAGTALLPLYLDHVEAAKTPVAIELRVRRGPRFVVDTSRPDLGFDGGTARRPDCIISADPVAFLLLSFGRLSPVSLLARGKVIAFGRRPWLALRLQKLLINP